MEAITKRLDVMREQLRKVFTATGTRSIEQLKAFIILGESRRNRGIHFLPQSTHNYVTSRTMLLMNSSTEIEQRFRLHHVNGRDHLFATENIVSDHEIINEIILRLQYTRDYIPESIRSTLEDEHSPYNSIEATGVRYWCLRGVPEEISDIIARELGRLTGGSKWIDVEELFENANRVQQLREWKRGLQQRHAGRSPLLNLPEEGPANLVGTFVTGARRMGGLRPGQGPVPRNLHIAGQEAVLIARLTPELPVIGDLRIPYRTEEEYREAARMAMNNYEVLRPRRRNRKTRKNRR